MNVINFIKQFEGFSATPYYCPSVYRTIGFGHRMKVDEHWEKLTMKEAEEVLAKDILQAEKGVQRLIRVPLNPNQFIALVSFTFNVGTGALQRSTLRQKVNRQDHEEVPEEFMKWIYGNGKILKGLIWRRITESNLYSSSI